MSGVPRCELRHSVALVCHCEAGLDGLHLLKQFETAAQISAYRSSLGLCKFPFGVLQGFRPDIDSPFGIKNGLGQIAFIRGFHALVARPPRRYGMGNPNEVNDRATTMNKRPKPDTVKVDFARQRRPTGAERFVERRSGAAVRLPANCDAVSFEL
jgi:hypothetical protein